MRMYFMHEARRESVPVSYVKKKKQDSIIGSLLFLEPWCVTYYLAVEVPKPFSNAPDTFNDAGTESRKTNRANHFFRANNYIRFWPCLLVRRFRSEREDAASIKNESSQPMKQAA